MIKSRQLIRLVERDRRFEQYHPDHEAGEHVLLIAEGYYNPNQARAIQIRGERVRDVLAEASEVVASRSSRRARPKGWRARKKAKPGKGRTWRHHR